MIDVPGLPPLLGRFFVIIVISAPICFILGVYANIKPLKKLVNKARDLRDHHQERHRPTGFGFALADSIDYLDASHWNAVTANNSVFLTPRYLADT